MSVTNEFFKPLTVSLITTFLSFLIAYAYRLRIRNIFLYMLRKMLKTGIINIFNNRAEAKEDLFSELKIAKKVKLLTGRGQELQSEAFLSLLGDRTRSNKCEFWVLLPKTIETFSGPDWTDINEKMIAQKDPAYDGTGLLKKQIETTASMIKEHEKNRLVKLKRYNNPHIGRIVLIENCAYFTAYEDTKHAFLNQVFKFERGSVFYNLFERYFDLLWNNNS